MPSRSIPSDSLTAVDRLSPSRPAKGRLRIGALLLTAAGAALAWSGIQPTPFDPAADIASICASDKPFANEVLGEPRYTFDVSVPTDTPLPGQGTAPSHAVARGDIIELRIHSPRAGSVAMHGIVEEHRLAASGSAFVRLQAKYTGRFPLHFHGADGSHFEVAVFEVR